MASIPEHVRIRGKIHSVDVAGRGKGSGMLTINVDGRIDGRSDQASAWVGCGDAPGDTACYPWIFSGYIETALAALKGDCDVEMLYYNIKDASGVPQPIITALTIYR